MGRVKGALGALFVLAAALAVGLSATGASAANATTCNGVLAPGSYGRVVVPAGASCFSDGDVTISGGVHATNPANLQIHFMTINGGIESSGGSGPFGGPFDITWTTIEDSQINGGVSITGFNGFWMGVIRNHVNGSVNLSGNVLVDEDGNEYVTNTIHGSLSCFGNSPAPQVGDSEGSPNHVTGAKKGQCAAV